jgi:hypothetical protein
MCERIKSFQQMAGFLLGSNTRKPRFSKAPQYDLHPCENEILDAVIQSESRFEVSLWKAASYAISTRSSFLTIGEKPVWALKFHSKKPLLDRMERKSNPSRLWKWLQVLDSREINGAPGGIRTLDLLVCSRTIKFHKLMNRRHMPVSNPLSIGLQIGLRACLRGNAEAPLSKNAKARIS